MASSGTLLSDLDSGRGAGSNQDDEYVRKILAEVNTGGEGNPVMGGGIGSMIMSPNPNTVAPIQMDNLPATSHIIGKDHPTPADFAAAIHGVSRAEPTQAMAPPQGNFAPYQNTAPAPMMPSIPEAPKKNMYARIAEELKTPILFTLMMFVFSLPFVHVLFSHYIPSLVKPSGDLTTMGLLAKSVLAGGMFWILQRVIAPLVSL
jgi:hypothetical protein